MDESVRDKMENTEYTLDDPLYLLSKISHNDLLRLEEKFKKTTVEAEIGLSKDNFIEIVKSIGSNEAILEKLAGKVFDQMVEKNHRETVTWNDFLDYLIENMFPEVQNALSLKVKSIETVAHTKIESVAKVVLIETNQYFSYAIILKHGRVGLYDGNLNFLTSYHAIMTREDLNRPEDERRRRNRWVTDAIFCSDTLMLIITNTARSIVIYEASGLKHVPYWLILSTPNITEGLAYKPFTKNATTGCTSSCLFTGDCKGLVMSFTFLQPKNGLLRRKRNDQITLFYWNDFLKEKDYVIVKKYGKVHKDSVTQIAFVEEMGLLITSSLDPETSVILTHTDHKNDTICYRMAHGTRSFGISPTCKVLITGSDDGLIRLWNIFISKTIEVFAAHQTKVVDIQVIDTQCVFLSCSADAVLKLWDLKESVCLQTIKLDFPCFRIHGKPIEWGVNCIYPGPKRRQLDESNVSQNKRECFGIGDVNEMKLEGDKTGASSTKRIWEQWERSCILVTCCNYFAVINTTFKDVGIESTFGHPILPAPPLQNSVLIPSSWGVQSEDFNSIQFNKDLKFNVEKQLLELRFILDRDILEDYGGKSDINYKIAILEAKKEKMHTKVALGSPYLALDIPEIEELKLTSRLTLNRSKKSEQYVKKINGLLQRAAHLNEIFSSPEPSSSRSKSNKSSVVEMPY